MSKPLPSQNTFTGLAPPWSLTNLDANFTNVWAAIDDIGTYSNTLTDTGAVNALVVTTPAGITFSLVSGITVCVVAANTITQTAPTLNVNGTGAKVVITASGGNNIFAGQIVAGGVYVFVYDGTDWRILNPAALPGVAVLSSNSNRSSVTALTPDSTLAINIPVGSGYKYDICFQATQGGGGLDFCVYFSGPFTQANSTAVYLSAIGGVAPVFSSVTSVQNALTAYISTPAGTIGGSVAYERIEGFLLASGTGTLSLAWAQNSSNATATSLLPGSYINVIML